MGFMKKIQLILLFSSFIIHVCYSQCPGDVNLDYRVDGEDILVVVDHVLTTGSIQDDSFINGDLDGSTVIDLFDLTALTDISLATANEWCEFQPIDLSSEWEIQQNLSYYDSEALQNIVSENVPSLGYIRGFIVIHRGKIVSEEYYYGSSMNQDFNVWSVTKSFISTLVGQAIDQGYITNQFVTLDSIFYENDYTSQVSLDHVLSMTSGWPENWYYMYTNNIINVLLDTGLLYEPGTQFFYNNAANHINGYVIQETTGMTPKTFAMEHLFPKLGLGNPYWGTDADGVNNGSYDLFLTLRKMVKLGQLYLQDGFAGDEQILSSEWINEATSFQAQAGWGDGYGYLWWLPGEGYLAIGLGGQFIVVIPQLDLVVGTHSSSSSGGNYFNTLLSIIYSQVVPLFDLSGVREGHDLDFKSLPIYLH